MSANINRPFHFADLTRGFEINGVARDESANFPMWDYAVTDLRTGRVVATGEAKGTRGTAFQYALNAMNQYELERDLSK